MRRLAGLVGDVRAATAFRYDAHDSVGNRMDTAKVIASPAGGYLAMYHDHETCHLATSTDLMTWTHRMVIDEPATQPTVASTGDGGLLTAAEFNDDRATGTAERLEVMTHGAAPRFANPTATMLRDPAGGDALMVTLFLPMEGATPGEAGSLLYVVPIGQTGPAASPNPPVSPP